MSDLISREALLEEVKVWLNSHKDDDRNIFDLITNAPAVSGEFGISFMKYTEFGVVPDDYKNQAGGYRAGWNDCIASVKYTITTQQQPQSVADALEEFAKAIKGLCNDYSSRNGSVYIGDVESAINELLKHHLPIKLNAPKE